MDWNWETSKEGIHDAHETKTVDRLGDYPQAEQICIP